MNDGLPLEANADICFGISFNKGCYVGQELTARSRFVGVIRKRIVPVVFKIPVDPSSYVIIYIFICIFSYPLLFSSLGKQSSLTFIPVMEIEIFKLRFENY